VKGCGPPPCSARLEGNRFELGIAAVIFWRLGVVPASCTDDDIGRAEVAGRVFTSIEGTGNDRVGGGRAG
jgi:hypothetical protein